MSVSPLCLYAFIACTGTALPFFTFTFLTTNSSFSCPSFLFVLNIHNQEWLENYCSEYLLLLFPIYEDLFVILWIIISFLCGPGSSVSIANDYGLGGLELNPGGDEIFCPSRPALGWSLHNDTTRPQPNHTVTPTHIKPEQYNTWNKSTISRKLLKMDVLTFKTCWAVNGEIIKQVTSSWSVFIQQSVHYQTDL